MTKLFKRLDRIFILILFGNLWIWKIFSLNAIVAIISISCSWLLYKAFRQHQIQFLLIFSFLVLAFFQLKTSDPQPLYLLSNQEKIWQVTRLNEYPPITWAPIAHWLEERKETLVLYRIPKNIGDILSPNLYFFSNHPNERVYVNEFEKFPYILLPFFAIGFLNTDYKKDKKIFFISFIIPVIFFALIGQSGALGPFLLFPYLVATTTFGTKYFYEKFKENKWIISLSMAAYLIVLIQIILYAKF